MGVWGIAWIRRSTRPTSKMTCRRTSGVSAAFATATPACVHHVARGKLKARRRPARAAAAAEGGESPSRIEESFPLGFAQFLDVGRGRENVGHELGNTGARDRGETLRERESQRFEFVRGVVGFVPGAVRSLARSSGHGRLANALMPIVIISSLPEVS